MNKKIKIATGIVIVAFILTVLIYLLPEDSTIFNISTSIWYISIAAIAGISGLLTFKYLGWKTQEGKVWFFLGLGFLSWALGEALWFFFELVLKIAPFPSIADIPYLAGYVFILIGLLVELKIIRQTVKNREILKAGLTTFILFVISSVFFLIPIATAVDYDLLSKIISLAYPIGDLMIIFPLIIFFFAFKGSKMAKSWVIVIAALIVTAVSDTLFGYIDWNELYTGTIMIFVDVLWITGYLLFAYAAYYHKSILGGNV